MWSYNIGQRDGKTLPCGNHKTVFRIKGVMFWNGVPGAHVPRIGERGWFKTPVSFKGISTGIDLAAPKIEGSQIDEQPRDASPPST